MRIRDQNWCSLVRKHSPSRLGRDAVADSSAPRRSSSRRASGTPGGERTAAAVPREDRVAGLLGQALCLGQDCRADGAKREALALLVPFQAFLREEGCNNMPRAINHSLATPPGSPPPARRSRPLYRGRGGGDSRRAPQPPGRAVLRLPRAPPAAPAWTSEPWLCLLSPWRSSPSRRVSKQAAGACFSPLASLLAAGAGEPVWEPRFHGTPHSSPLSPQLTRSRPWILPLLRCAPGELQAIAGVRGEQAGSPLPCSLAFLRTTLVKAILFAKFTD